MAVHDDRWRGRCRRSRGVAEGFGGRRDAEAKFPRFRRETVDRFVAPRIMANACLRASRATTTFP